MQQMQGIGEARHRLLWGGRECETSFRTSLLCFVILSFCSCLSFEAPSRIDDVKSCTASCRFPQEIGKLGRCRPTFRHRNITPSSTLRIVDVFRPTFLPKGVN